LKEKSIAALFGTMM